MSRILIFIRLCECVCLIRKQRRRTTRRGRWRRRSREPSWRRRKQSGRSRSASRRRSSWLTWTKVCHFFCHQRDRHREGGRRGGRALLELWFLHIWALKLRGWCVRVEGVILNRVSAALQQTDEAVFSLCLTRRRVHTDKHTLQEERCVSVWSTPARAPSPCLPLNQLWPVRSALMASCGTWHSGSGRGPSGCYMVGSGTSVLFLSHPLNAQLLWEVGMLVASSWAVSHVSSAFLTDLVGNIFAVCM